MKHTSNSTFLFLAFLLFSCVSQNANYTKEEARNTGFVTSDTLNKSIGTQDFSVANDKSQIIKKIKKHIDSVKTVLTKLTPQQANALYSETKTFISQQIEAYGLDWYTDLTDLSHAPDSIKQQVQLFTTANLEVWDIGEGYLELRTVPDFYLQLFGKYVSKDYKDYIQLVCKEDSVLYDADAGLNISFEDIGNRMIDWERFMQQYPKSDLKDIALEKYIFYMQGYLMGEDNTPAFEDNKPVEEAARAYNNIARQNATTFTGILSLKYITRFKKESTSDARHAFLDSVSTEIRKK